MLHDGAAEHDTQKGNHVAGGGIKGVIDGPILGRDIDVGHVGIAQRNAGAQRIGDHHGQRIHELIISRSDQRKHHIVDKIAGHGNLDHFEPAAGTADDLAPQGCKDHHAGDVQKRQGGNIGIADLDILQQVDRVKGAGDIGRKAPEYTDPD